MKMTLDNFGSHLLWPDKNPLVSPAADNLNNMALIEAAYLSARTGMPEQPGENTENRVMSCDLWLTGIISLTNHPADDSISLNL